MKYVFVDTDNGVTTPAGTVDGTTGKYHTTSSWPASTATWSSLANVFANTTIRGITDDVTVYCRGATADTNGGTTSNMTCASLLVEGDLAGPAWNTSKYRIEYTGAGQAGLTATGASMGNFTARKLQILGNGTSTSPATLLLAPSTGSKTFTVENCIVRQGSTGRSSATSSSRGIFLSSAQSSLTLNISNTIVYDIGSTSNVSTAGIRQGNTTSAVTVNIYNSVVANVTDGGAAASTGIDAIAADTVTVKNCAVFGTDNDFNNCDTVAYCASDDGDGTNAVTGLTWANQFVDYANGNFALKSGSSLIGAGIGPSSDANVPTTDIAGIARSGTTTDIGAAMFVSGGLTITSVNTTNTAFSAQTDSAVIGTGLSASVVCTYAGIACTNESASSSTSLKITFPNFFTNNIKLGRNYEFKAVG